MTFFVCTIEPDPSHFIGAVLLHRSLVANCGKPFDFRLTLIRRGSDDALFADLADSLGIKVRLAESHFQNPFLNKWPGLAAHKDIRGAKHVVCLDWDMLLVRPGAFSAPFPNAITARPNPRDMYAARLAALKRRIAEPPLIDSNFHVPSSINGGLLIGSEEQLRRCGQSTIRYEELIGSSTQNWDLWEREQLALSLAVGEIGLHPLDPSWNATHRAEVRPEKIFLWHYNDGWQPTFRLKRCLQTPPDALARLREIQVIRPKPVAVFLQHYGRILEEPWFQRLSEPKTLRNVA
jgi:hypothetical protein